LPLHQQDHHHNQQLQLQQLQELVTAVMQQEADVKAAAAAGQTCPAAAAAAAPPASAQYPAHTAYILPNQQMLGALPHLTSNPAAVRHTLNHPPLLPSHWALLLLLVHK
jgi:hypothetical protein